MIEDKDKIKDLFSSKLGNFEPEVPASLWGGLDQLLSNQPVQAPDASSSSSSANSSTTHAASSTGKASIIKTIAIAVGVAAAIATGVLLMPEKETVIDKPVAKEVQQPEEQPQVVDTVMEVPEVKPPLIAKAKALPPAKEIIAAEPEQVAGQVQDDGDILVAKEKPASKEASEKTEEPALLAEANVLLPKKKSPSGGFSLGVSGDAGLLASNTTERGGGLLFSRRTRSNIFHEALTRENSEFELEHRQPISFGITLSKQIGPRLSLETGLVYTHLSSKITSNSVFKINESQYFNYLGIPLTLNYTFYELGKTKFYLSVGGMVQKDINGRYTSNIGFNLLDIDDDILAGQVFYSEPYYVRESIKQSRPQFSAKTTIGVAYPLYRRLYIYGTIGGAYYFDAGNQYRTIYSDKKTQLDLNLGIKFDF